MNTFSLFLLLIFLIILFVATIGSSVGWIFGFSSIIVGIIAYVNLKSEFTNP